MVYLDFLEFSEGKVFFLFLNSSVVVNCFVYGLFIFVLCWIKDFIFLGDGFMLLFSFIIFDFNGIYICEVFLFIVLVFSCI